MRSESPRKEVFGNPKGQDGVLEEWLSPQHGDVVKTKSKEKAKAIRNPRKTKSLYKKGNPNKYAIYAIANNIENT